MMNIYVIESDMILYLFERIKIRFLLKIETIFVYIFLKIINIDGKLYRSRYVLCFKEENTFYFLKNKFCIN